MRPQTQKIARFGLLTALALVLGLMDRAIPVSALLGGVLPGIKLGLANTVLLYAVYLMDWKSCVALMLTKVVLSGFLFGSLSAILFSLSGGVLSLIVMLLIRKKPEAGAVATILLTAAAEIYLLGKNRNPQGEMLITVILIGFAFIAGIIKLARENRNASNESEKLLSSEPYPLVMDAPLSAFDKRRIKTVCTALPEVAEQVMRKRKTLLRKLAQ